MRRSAHVAGTEEDPGRHPTEWSYSAHQTLETRKFDKDESGEASALGEEQATQLIDMVDRMVMALSISLNCWHHPSAPALRGPLFIWHVHASADSQLCYYHQLGTRTRADGRISMSPNLRPSLSLSLLFGSKRWPAP